MGLIHTCTKYGYMQAHTKDMHEKEKLYPNNMIMESQLRTCQIEITKISELFKFGFEKSMDLPNLDLKSHAMSVTYIIKLIILQTTHNIFHISYHVFYIILSYAMRPWDHGLDVRTSQNEGSTYETSTRDPSLANKVCFIHSYVLHFSFFHILVQSPVILGV